MKNVYCIRKGKALVVTQTQFVEWFTDNFSAEMITKKEWQDAKAKELRTANLHPIFQSIFLPLI